MPRSDRAKAVELTQIGSRRLTLAERASQGHVTTSQGEQTVLILGASGDLAARLLLPGLGNLIAGRAVEGVSLVGSAAHDWNDERWRSRVAEAFAAAGATGERIDAVASSTPYIKADVTAEREWRRLLDACEGRVVIYFALPPATSA